MQIVINIPEKINNRLRSFWGHGYALRDEDVKIIAEAIYNGQTQPEGIKYVELPEEDYAKMAELMRKSPPIFMPAQPEIIRCGECKWFQCNMRMDGYLPKGVDEFECRHWCGSCDPVDFCSHAERREE